MVAAESAGGLTGGARSRQAGAVDDAPVRLCA